MAGVCEHWCRITGHRRVGPHPRHVGVPRMCANASLSAGAETTVSCGATDIRIARVLPPSVLSDALQRLSVYLILWVQMEPGRNELVKQGLQRGNHLIDLRQGQ